MFDSVSKKQIFTTNLASYRLNRSQIFWINWIDKTKLIKYLPFAPGNFSSSLRIISVGNGHNDWRENKEMGTLSLTSKQGYVKNHIMEDASLKGFKFTIRINLLTVHYYFRFIITSLFLFVLLCFVLFCFCFFFPKLRKLIF